MTIASSQAKGSGINNNYSIFIILYKTQFLKSKLLGGIPRRKIKYPESKKYRGTSLKELLYCIAFHEYGIVPHNRSLFYL